MDQFFNCRSDARTRDDGPVYNLPWDRYNSPRSPDGSRVADRVDALAAQLESWGLQIVCGQLDFRPAEF